MNILERKHVARGLEHIVSSDYALAFCQYSSAQKISKSPNQYNDILKNLEERQKESLEPRRYTSKYLK